MPTRITIAIDADGPAFEGEELGPEVARILRRAADTFHGEGRPPASRDYVERIGTVPLVDGENRPAGTLEVRKRP